MKKKKKDNYNRNENNIKFCKACGSKIILSKHVLNEDGIKIWLQCEQCDIMTHSFQTYLDAVREWNSVN